MHVKFLQLIHFILINNFAETDHAFNMFAFNYI